MIILLAFTPSGQHALGGHGGLYPHWLLPSYDPDRWLLQMVLVATLLVTLLVAAWSAR